MKKLSILLAVILTGNIFAATTSASASTATVSDATIELFDFNDATGTALDAKLQPNNSYTCAGYEQVDAEHGLSLKMNTSSKIRYNFDSSVDGEVTISFDMYAKGALSKFWVTSTDAAEAASDGASYIWANGSKWVLNWYGAQAEDLGAYSIEKWYNVKLVIADIRGTKPSVKYYIDDTLKIERPLGNDTNGYITFAGGGAEGSEVLLDNIRISKQLSFSEDFDNLAGRWTNNFSAKIETLNPAWYWEGYESDSTNVKPNWYNHWAEIDTAHGKSLGTGGSAAFYYKLPAALKEDATLSFELYTQDINDEGTIFIRGDAPGIGSWTDANVLGVLNKSTLNLGNVNYTVAEKAWYRIDMKFDIGTGTTCRVEYYVNGVKIGSATKNVPTHITFKASNRKTETSFTYIDNFSLTVPAKWFAITGVKVKDGEATIDSVSAWNASKEYTISADVENSTSEPITIHVVAAGYDANNRFVNCGIVPINITDSGIYTAKLRAVNMTGATKIKIFAFNNYTSLSPVTIDAVELN